jgi:enamine deaminase RidA (YjgF/YER057c/UK114 family)
MRGMDDSQISQRLSELDIELPPAPRPAASYVSVRIAGDTAYVAGQVPTIDGSLVHPGRLGDPSAHVTVDEGVAAARQAALQALAALRAGLGGFDRLAGISQVTVYIASAPDFVEHPVVANGASDVLIEILGDEGKHARAAIGMASLPLGACVEVAVTARLTTGS